MRPRFSTGLVLAGVASTSLVLAGCASPQGDTTDAAESGLVQVVASTNVYGDIAARVGGDLVSVTSIIESQSQDPHSYEASARDQLTLSRAALVIENGGGYDPFIDTLLDGLDTDDVVVVSASEESGHLEDDHPGGDAAADDNADGAASEDDHTDHDHIEGFNEHVWYSFSAMDHLAKELAHELGELDSENSAVYESNYKAFASELAELGDRADQLATEVEGVGVAVTEPVPVYLLERVGLSDKTPDAFSEAFEAGSDVPPAVLQETLALFPAGEVGLLAYNEQTTGPETEQVRAAADEAGVPVISFSETMPEGGDYIGWMSDNLDALSDALT